MRIHKADHSAPSQSGGFVASHARTKGKTQSFSILILLGLALFTVESFSLQDDKQNDIRTIYQQYFLVRKLFDRKAYTEALAGSKKIIDRKPDFYEIYPYFARISKAANQVEKSVVYLQQLIQKRPDQTAYYYGLGLCLRIQQKLDQSADAYKKAIDLRAPSILIYYELVAPFQGDFSELIKYFEEKARVHPMNPFIYYGMGIVYEYKLKKYDLALNYYQQAVKVARDAGRTPHAGQLLNHIGVYYWNRGNFAKALEYYRQAVDTVQETAEKSDLARYLFNCGLASCSLGDLRPGLGYYEKALKNDQDVGLKDHEAQTLRNIGYVHYQFSDYSRALNYYNQALAIVRDIGDKAAEGRYLADLTSVYWTRGDYPRALEYGETGLKLAQENRDKYGETTALRFIGNTHWTMGYFSKALECYLKALKESQIAGNKTNEALCLNDIGLIYRETGDYPRALDYYERALKIFRETGGKIGEGTCLNNIANIYMTINDNSRALGYLEKALKIAQETGNRYFESNRLNNIGNVQSRLGNDPRALEYFEEALKIAKGIRAKEREAAVFRDRGFVFLKMNHLADSIDSFEKALVLALEIGQPTTTWLAYSGLARALEQDGRSEEALANYKKSVQVIEDIRARFPSEEQRAGYLKDKIKVYESLISLFFALHQRQPSGGYDRESFYYAEKAKARAFLDSLEEAKVDLRAGLSSQIREEEIKVSREISRLQTDLARPGLPEEKRGELFQKLEEVEEAYRNIIQAMRMNNPKYAQLAYPEPKKLEDIQARVLGQESALLEYFVGEESAFLFYVTKNDMAVYKLAGSKELQERANNYLKLLSLKTGRDFAAHPAGKKMYGELIGPVGDKIVNARKLIIVPDGSLNYLPFEALIRDQDSPVGEAGNHVAQDSGIRAPGKFLVEDYVISYAPSASSLMNLLDRKGKSRAKKLWLAFADPVYAGKGSLGQTAPADEISREYYLGKGFDFSPLPYSGEEVKIVSKLIRRGQREIYTQEEAKEEKLKAIPLKDFKILHFATHGLLDENVSLRSALVLTLDEDPKEDGFFQVREIYGTQLDSDLVVLSACQTGKGELESGEGVSGLSRAFLYAGAQAVLASLWNINDRATAGFMGHFYRYLNQGKSKDEALQSAKLDMLKSSFRHPFYWAAFVVIGDSQSAVDWPSK
jgi:CHAT domain-containing protein/tetratricopeptide (TPR) repeat protein